MLEATVKKVGLGKLHPWNCRVFFVTSTHLIEQHDGRTGQCQYPKGTIAYTLSRASLRVALKKKRTRRVGGWPFHLDDETLQIGCHIFTGTLRAKILKWARGRR